MIVMKHARTCSITLRCSTAQNGSTSETACCRRRETAEISPEGAHGTRGCSTWALDLSRNETAELMQILQRGIRCSNSCLLGNFLSFGDGGRSYKRGLRQICSLVQSRTRCRASQQDSPAALSCTEAHPSIQYGIVYKVCFPSVGV